MLYGLYSRFKGERARELKIQLAFPNSSLLPHDVVNSYYFQHLFSDPDDMSLRAWVGSNVRVFVWTFLRHVRQTPKHDSDPSSFYTQWRIVTLALYFETPSSPDPRIPLAVASDPVAPPQQWPTYVSINPCWMTLEPLETTALDTLGLL